ncbi:MAG: MarC family protein [Candidatus Binatia bacterium]
MTLTGLDMLRKHDPGTADDPATALSAAEQLIVPVAMPLIAGPGTIITAMTMAAAARTTTPPWMVLSAAGVTAAVTVWLVLALSGWMQQRLGSCGQAIVVRFMGWCRRCRRQLALGGISEFFGLGRQRAAGAAPG